MEIYRVTADSPEWQRIAYNSIRVDAFCFGQHIPVELEFSHDESSGNFRGILVVDNHVPVAGLRIAYPREGTAKIERVCTVREKQKSGYGRIMIDVPRNGSRKKEFPTLSSAARTVPGDSMKSAAMSIIRISRRTHLIRRVLNGRPES